MGIPSFRGWRTPPNDVGLSNQGLLEHAQHRINLGNPTKMLTVSLPRTILAAKKRAGSRLGYVRVCLPSTIPIPMNRAGQQAGTCRLSPDAQPSSRRDLVTSAAAAESNEDGSVDVCLLFAGFADVQPGCVFSSGKETPTAGWICPS